MKFEAILIEYIWKQSGKWLQRKGTWKGLRYDRKQHHKNEIYSQKMKIQGKPCM